MESKFVELK